MSKARVLELPAESEFLSFCALKLHTAYYDYCHNTYTLTL
jgi:hypothetical protein